LAWRDVGCLCSRVKVYGFQFTLQVEHDAVQITGVESAEIIEMDGDHFGLANISDGQITVSWNNVSGEGLDLEPGQVLFYVDLIASKNIQLSDVLTLNGSITSAEAYSVDLIPKPIALRFTEDTQRFVELYQAFVHKEL